MNTDVLEMPAVQVSIDRRLSAFIRGSIQNSSAKR